MLPDGYFNAWAGLGLKVYHNGKVTFVNKEFQEKNVAGVGGMVYCAYFQAGITVVTDGQKHCAIDMVNLKPYYTDDAELDRATVYEIATITKYGLTIPDRKCLKLMGKDELGNFLKTREEHYEKWKFEQFTHPLFPIDNLAELIGYKPDLRNRKSLNDQK